MPERRWYDKFTDQPTTEVALERSLKEDLFVVLASLDRSGVITLRGIINPLINWIWIGAVVTALAGFFILLPEGKKKGVAA